ncbi:DedA family protein [Tepidibacillus sp. LV47]|uniref:DedA family protein n=1 Tax=Tepidibacillus sp. LV47 TaxID=3398228 RepID=UPI003AABCB48
MRDTILHIIANYGYIGIFVSLILGIVGLPIPDETIMMLAGYLITKEHLNYFLTILVAFSGSMIGMTVSFIIGKRLGLPFLEKYGAKIRVTPERLKHVEKFFNRFGKYTVSIGYYIAGVRHFSAIFAGISNWSYGTFALYAFPGGLVWVLVFVNLGYFLGEHWHHLYKIIHHYMRIALIIVIIGAIFWGYFIYKKKQIPRKGQMKS